MSLNREKIYERYKRIYDPMYSISQCGEDEIVDVIRFIDTYWKKGHALVKSKELLDWQYFDHQNHKYNFIIARSRETGEIHAIEGFIPTSQFDKTIKEPMTWGSIWKSIPDVAPPGLGLVVKMFREINFDTKYHCEVGVSADAENYNKQFGNTIYELGNWYIVNPELQEYKLIEAETEKEPVQSTGSCALKLIVPIDSEWDTAFDSIHLPEYKSKAYYINRYLKHPVYKYHLALLQDSKTDAREAFIFRIPEHGGDKGIFIVDYLGVGTTLSNSGNAVLNLLKQYEAEYILFPCHGINESYLKGAGFSNTKETSDVVPMYYEPFLKKNVEIICASRYSNIGWYTFKGDADQDRPNIISE